MKDHNRNLTFKFALLALMFGTNVLAAQRGTTSTTPATRGGPATTTTPAARGARASTPAPRGGAAATTTPAPRGGATATATTPPAPRGKMTLENLITDIKEATSTKKDPFLVERDVRERGVDFEATDENLETLRSAGAWAELRALVSKYQTKAIAPPPPPKLTATLTVACEPVDCRVIVRSSDGSFTARTENKSRVFESVPAGPVEILTFADGYLEKSQTLQLAGGASVKAPTLVLDPSRPAGLDRLMGKSNLFDLYEATSLVDAIEGRAGTLDWRGADGADHAWNVVRFLKKAGENLTIVFETRERQGSCTTTIAPGTTRVTCQRSLRGYEKDAEKAARLFLTYQPYDFVRRLPKEAASSSESDTKQVSFTSDGASYTLSLDSNDQLAEVRHQDPKTSSLIVRYSSYLSPDEKPGPGRYPMWIQVMSQDSKEQWDFRIDGIRRP